MEGGLLEFTDGAHVRFGELLGDALPCDMRSDGAEWHGHYIIGVRHLSTAGAQRYYHLVSGTLSVSSIGPDGLRATFTAALRSQDDPADTITISGGSIDVPYVSSMDAAALLQCLIGSGGEACGEATVP